MNYRVRYTEFGTGRVMLTGLTTLADATLKAAFLNGEVIRDE
jgi:hypothetical protein